MPSPAYDISAQDAASLEDLRRAVNDRLRRLSTNGSLQITGPLDMQGNRIVNLGAPGALSDAATLADVRRASTSASSSRKAVEEAATGIEVRPVHF